MIPATHALIDLAAVEHNLDAVKNLAPDANVMAVIKANGYGHGLLRIAEALKKADAYAVARIDEGIRLRKAGLQKRIVVLEGFTYADELDEFIEYQLDAVVHSSVQLGVFESRPGSDQVAVWLKLDTGMNRLGFRVEEFDSVYQRLAVCSNIKKPVNLMTHLANADDRHDETTQMQIRLFNDTVQAYSGQRSIANSAGILGWKESITGWVRPGIMLYGISPFPEMTGRELDLQPVMSLHSRLIAVKPVKSGDKVGYGGSWRCNTPTLIGIVAAGYGDGYPRHAKSGTPVLVNGQRAPLVGRVSMDMITVDLVSQPDAKPGDAVILWGKDLPVEEIALWADTIPYTLVCGVTQRVQIICD